MCVCVCVCKLLSTLVQVLCMTDYNHVFTVNFQQNSYLIVCVAHIEHLLSNDRIRDSIHCTS